MIHHNYKYIEEILRINSRTSTDWKKCSGKMVLSRKLIITYTSRLKKFQMSIHYWAREKNVCMYCSMCVCVCVVVHACVRVCVCVCVWLCAPACMHTSQPVLTTNEIFNWIHCMIHKGEKKKTLLTSKIFLLTSVSKNPFVHSLLHIVLLLLVSWCTLDLWQAKNILRDM